MIIEKIDIKNFMCYAGQNEFSFAPGMNVIIGDNGYGKSKLYDAFSWAMYDECFDTNDKKPKKTRFIGKSIISDKAVFEAEGGIVEASVRITFRDTEKDEQFEISRTLKGQKRGKDFITDAESIEEVTFRQIAGMTGRLLSNPDEIARVKRKILPDNIRPYMWFQGEQVESIIDFGESTSLSQAINVLSNISRFDQISEVAEALEKSALDQYHRKVRAQSGDKQKSDELETRREKIIERIAFLDTDIRTIKENLGNAEENAEKLINQQEVANEIRIAEERNKQLEADLNRIAKEEEVEKVNLHKKMFSRHWVLKGTDALVKQYNDKFLAYQEKKLAKKAALQAKLDLEQRILKEMQTRLPINVPEPMYVEKMLDEERCLVCNREAPKESEAWVNIKQLLSRNHIVIPETVEEDVLNFESDFKRLSQNGYAMEQAIFKIDEDIAQTFTRLRDLDSRRKEVASIYKKTKDDLAAMVAETSLTEADAKNLLNTLHRNHEYAQRFQTNLVRAEMELNQKKEDLFKIDKDLSELVTEALPAWLEEKKQLLIDFKEITQSTRARVFKKLVEQLEAEANKHYRSMMQGNLSARGLIKLVESTKGNYMPKLVDENGSPLMQLNTGNIILIKLATIMAIISARQGSRDTELYTLITDAPMSVFGEDYTIGFCKTVSSVYRQSIIMSKEFYKNEGLRRQLLNDPEIKLGKVYKITPSIPESERSNRNSLTTNIEALN
jgi:DNA sulfur modification protein DndD